MLTAGKGAVLSVLARFIHPSEHIRRCFPNYEYHLRLENLTALRQEERTVRQKKQLCVVFVTDEVTDDNGAPIELYCVRCYAKVAKEGPPEDFFQRKRQRVAKEKETTENEEIPDNDNGEEESPADAEEMPPNIAVIDARNRILPEDISDVRNVGIWVDDDNDPLPENVPELVMDGDEQETPKVLEEEFGHEGICYRRMAGGMNAKARINGSSNIMWTRLQLFEMFLPKTFIQTVILPQTNKNLKGKPLLYGEFLQWIGLMLMTATLQGFQRRDFWSMQQIDTFETAPIRFGSIMKRNRFEEILRALTYTDEKAPSYIDGFWEVRQLLKAWNDNMAENFTSSWISCLDESMMKWLNKFTCPGFMFVPRKPWPFGNEFHTIACGETGILFALEIVEGKDQPREKKKEFSNLGKTTSLLLWLTKTLWGSGKVVVLDSGFCVLKALVELKKKGVFSAALIKKRRYWPKYIDGDRIKAHFNDQEVGHVDALKGTLDGVPFYIHAMKEPDYVMMLMATYGSIDRTGETKSRRLDNGDHISFRYPEVVHNHYKYRDAVDAHNARRQHPIALEESWTTDRWPNRVFSYLLATTEVNANLAEAAFGSTEKPMPQLRFRRQLVRDLINNPYRSVELSLGEKSRKSSRVACMEEHDLIKIPRFHKFSGTRIVRAKSPYPTRECDCGSSRVRTYCKCSPGTYRCIKCFGNHRAVAAEGVQEAA